MADTKGDEVRELTDKQIWAVADAIANVDLRPDQHMSDNVAIMVVGAYEDDHDCPDEEADEELHWKPWALEKEKDLRRRMALAAIKAYERHILKSVHVKDGSEQ